LPSVLILGGGLAGLSAAAALGGAGFEVDLLESRNFLGGRATSWPIGEGADVIDNCQHVLLRCCHNLMDFYARLNVDKRIHFYKDFFFIEPGGRVSTLSRGILPPPAHFTGSFLKLKFLTLSDKLGIARAMLALRAERHRTDLDRITMLDWLHEKRQSPRAIERYWRQVLVSAINEELDRMAAAHAFQVFLLGMLANRISFEMGVPDIPLRELYTQIGWDRIGNVRIHPRSAVTAIDISDARATGARVSGICSAGESRTADYYISALPFDRLSSLGIPVPTFDYSPITGIHLWFDRPITELPHATLLDRTIQWLYNKSGGRYVQLVVSASRSLSAMPRAEVIALAVRELAEFFPIVNEATLERAEVIKEIRATFSAAPGLESIRPPAETHLSNFFLAGDWTRSGWPATMEGAVRSGYLAAEAVTKAAGAGQRFLIPDAA
jgi:squalene-associated FAD-dependent desaturase